MHIVRLRKKTLYGLFYLVFWVGVISGGVWLIKPAAEPKPIPTPPLSNLQEVEVESVDFVSHGTLVDAVALLRNPNPLHGEDDLEVTFQFLDSTGTLLAERQVKTYLTPGSVQYVVALGVPVAQPASTVTAELSEKIPSIAINKETNLPRFNTTLRQRTLRQRGQESFEEQTGIVINNSTFAWERVEVSAVARDQSGQVVGIGKTFVGGLLVGEQREFTIQWPAPISPTVQVIPLAITNIFNEENILRTLGDPGSLR